MSFHSENASNIFRPHIKLEKFTNSTITGHFGFVVQRKTRAGKSNDYRDSIVLEKLLFQNVYTKTKSRRFQTPPV